MEPFKEQIHSKSQSKKNKINILGLSIFSVIGILIIILICMWNYYDKFKNKQLYKPGNNYDWHMIMTTLLFVMMSAGILKYIGNKTPILKNIGGGSILCLLVPALLFQLKIRNIPSGFQDFRNFFVSTESESPGLICRINSNRYGGLLDFILSCLVVGSLLNLETKKLKIALKKFLPLVLISLTISAIVIGLIGLIFQPIKGIDSVQGSNSNNGFLNALFYIFVPISSGGIICGIIPLTTNYASVFNTKQINFQDHVMPSLLISSILGIMYAGIMKKIFSNRKYNSPDGKIEKYSLPVDKITKENYGNVPLAVNNTYIGTGFVLISALYCFCSLLRSTLIRFKASLDAYLPQTIIFLVILTLILKLLDVIPKRYLIYINQASKFIIDNFAIVVLFLVGCSININQVIDNLKNLSFVITCIACLTITTLCVFLLSSKFGYYPVQAALSGGLCSCNVGGTGNVAILEASDSLHLLSYAQISASIAGGLVTALGSIFYPLFFG